MTRNIQISKHKMRMTMALAAVIVFAVLLSSCGPEKMYPNGKTVGIAMPTKNIERFERDGQFLKNSA